MQSLAKHYSSLLHFDYTHSSAIKSFYDKMYELFHSWLNFRNWHDVFVAILFFLWASSSITRHQLVLTDANSKQMAAYYILEFGRKFWKKCIILSSDNINETGKADEGLYLVLRMWTKVSEFMRKLRNIIHGKYALLLGEAIWKNINHGKKIQ